MAMIVAASENGVIGRDGGLPWHISADLRRFKKRVLAAHAQEFFLADEMIVLPVDLAGARLARRAGDGKRQVGIGFEKAVAQRRLAGPGRAGDDEHQPAAGNAIDGDMLHLFDILYLFAQLIDHRLQLQPGAFELDRLRL